MNPNDKGAADFFKPKVDDVPTWLCDGPTSLSPDEMGKGAFIFKTKPTAGSGLWGWSGSTSSTSSTVSSDTIEKDMASEVASASRDTVADIVKEIAKSTKDYVKEALPGDLLNKNYYSTLSWADGEAESAWRASWFGAKAFADDTTLLKGARIVGKSAMGVGIGITAITSISDSLITNSFKPIVDEASATTFGAIGGFCMATAAVSFAAAPETLGTSVIAGAAVCLGAAAGTLLSNLWKSIFQ